MLRRLEFGIRSRGSRVARLITRLSALTLALIGLSQQLFGYTDPGSGTLLIQLISAAALGGLFYLNKLVRFFRRKRDE